MAKPILFVSTIVLSFFCSTFAFESPLHDFCVATPSGSGCKDPKTVKADDFFAWGLNKPSDTRNIYGSGIIPVAVTTMPGLNNLGISLARADLLPNGLFPPHIHPRATEIVTVLEGSMQVGFVTSNPDYKHFTKRLEKGDAFVTPPGLVHYAYNVGNGTCVAMVAWNSHDLGGIVLLPKAIFGSNPGWDADYLAKSFQTDKKIVKLLQGKFKA